MKRLLAAAVFAMTFATQASAEDAVCYNCPPQWADWASMLKAIDKEIDVQMPHDNKNSGQTLAQLLAEKDSPIADVAYYGVTTGIKAGNKGVATAYKPTGFDEIPDGLKDPNGKWFAIHYGSLGFFVNVDALGGVARIGDLVGVTAQTAARLLLDRIPQDAGVQGAALQLLLVDHALEHMNRFVGRRPQAPVVHVERVTSYGEAVPYLQPVGNVSGVERDRWWWQRRTFDCSQGTVGHCRCGVDHFTQCRGACNCARANAGGGT